MGELRAEKMEKRRMDRIAQRRADAIAAKKEALAVKKAEEDRIGRSSMCVGCGFGFAVTSCPPLYFSQGKNVGGTASKEEGRRGEDDAT